jgi:hypothetical protein
VVANVRWRWSDVVKVPKRKVLQQGDVAAIPLPSGGFAAAVIARSKKRTDSVVFVYVFGPRYKTRKQIRESVTSFQASSAIYRSKAGAGRDWSNEGRIEDFARDEWPMPPLLRVCSLTGRRRLVRYDDDDPARELSSSPVRGGKSTTNSHAEDGLDGPLALSSYIDDLLARADAKGTRRVTTLVPRSA